MIRKSSYNITYEKLVINKNDYVGMVAYALYKRELVSHLKSGKTKGTFLDVNKTTSARRRYRKEAQSFMDTVLKINLESNLDTLKAPLVKQIQDIARDSIKPIRKRDQILAWHNSGLGGFVPTVWKMIIVFGLFWTPYLNSILESLLSYVLTLPH